MAKLVFKDCFISINSVDHSASVSKAELKIEAEDQDATTFGSGGWKEVLQGLKSGTLSVTFKADYSAGAADELLWTLFNAGTAVPFEIRPTSAAVGTSNPKYTGNLVPKSIKSLGQVGDVAEIEIEFPTTGAIARATV